MLSLRRRSKDCLHEEGFRCADPGPTSQVEEFHFPLSHSFSPFACNFRNYVLGCFSAPSQIAVSRSADGRVSMAARPPVPLASVRPSVPRMNVPLRTRKCCPIRRGQPQPQPVPEQSPSVRITQVSNANREPKARKGDWERKKYRGDYFYGKSGYTLSENERSVRG